MSTQQLLQTADDLNIARLRLKLMKLIGDAQVCGIVFTVSLEPHQPLAMGNYRMVSDFRVRRA